MTGRMPPKRSKDFYAVFVLRDGDKKEMEIREDTAEKANIYVAFFVDICGDAFYNSPISSYEVRERK